MKYNYNEAEKEMIRALIEPSVGYSEQCAKRIVRNHNFSLFIDLKDLIDFFNDDREIDDLYIPVDGVDYDLITIFGDKYYIVCFA